MERLWWKIWSAPSLVWLVVPAEALMRAIGWNAHWGLSV
jgi:hypothetical protein